MTTQVTPGDTHHAWQFGRQIQLSLTALAKRKRLDVSSDYRESFGLFEATTLYDPAEFDVLTMRCTKKASCNEHHTIVVSDFWGSYMDAMRQLKHMDYRQASKEFILQICSISPLLAQEWLEIFHIHFVRIKHLPGNLREWQDLVIADHNSDISYILDYECKLLSFDEPTSEEPNRVGYTPVNPLELVVKYMALAKAHARY